MNLRHVLGNQQSWNYEAAWKAAYAEFPLFQAYFVEAEEPELLYYGESTDLGSWSELAGHLQSDLDDFQRVREHHLPFRKIHKNARSLCLKTL